jgi:uncharacterized protein YqhQ
MPGDLYRRAEQSQLWLSRKVPRTLSTFQIVLLVGFASLLILRSTVGGRSLNYSTDQPQLESDEIPNKTQEAKRNLAQVCSAS